jgi:hypothetical protein
VTKPKSDLDLIMEGLREIIAAPATSAKAREAKLGAARQLARMQGLLPTAAEREHQLEDEAFGGPDPMEDLDELAVRRKRKQAQG